MSDTRNQGDYLQKAAMYDSLAQFYKYTNPTYHMHFYLKHLHYMNKAITMIRTQPQLTPEEAKIRVFHTSYDSSNIDFYVNGKRVLSDLPFKNVSTTLALNPGKYHVDIYPSGNMVDSVLNKKIIVEPGKSYTLTTIDSMKKMRLLQFENQPVIPRNEAQFRFIHLSPDTPALDIAVKNRDVIFQKIAYKQATDYLGLTPMTVDLETRETGTKTVILSMPKLQFTANKSYTIALIGLTKGEPLLQFISMED
ncbi:DUF4397 domain-containing protein [Neobacillus kokaensis]|uniref:DUF4397 domain-containing protein n=1 Tax=Neobacillus kokaensis TaxID=2759023 RepID=A0ABQ3N2H5_9BACI|nr:DUF4397 domain-containing protein [Neobacillus kokaensis]GHH98299.1 hypothetical protein AM1BK_18420 [Neobacillus kokaensis]